MTDKDKTTIKLKVAEENNDKIKSWGRWSTDVGKDIVRIDEIFREKLSLKPFDVVEVTGENLRQP